MAKDTRSITITIPRHVTMEGRGATYARWGKACCPPSSNLIYSGYAAGGHYSKTGNSANFICMPTDPDYLSPNSPTRTSVLHGAEYESANSKNFGSDVNDYNVPCAMCHAPKKSTAFMFPARIECPSDWNLEYNGFLTTSLYSHKRNSAYECVDANPDGIPGTKASTNGALFYFVTPECNKGIPCGPYDKSRALTCAVCTK